MWKFKKDKICVFLDIEGPCTLNDNAFELLVALAARAVGLGKRIGIEFYRRISNIDDIWGDFGKLAGIDPSYSSGHTLKIILPFFKAMDATSEWMYEFSKNSIRVVPNIKQVLTELDSQYNVWQISTSYEWFIRAFCNLVGFDFARARCTFVKGFDKIPIAKTEADLLKEFMKDVAEMPVIEYDGETGEVIEKHQDFYNKITAFIWEILYRTMPVGELLRTVHPVGQVQKREAVEQICKEFDVPKGKVFYIGDSQTDLEVVRWLRNAGLSLMFNGKGKVCELSDIMYIGEDARAISEIADLFTRLGRSETISHCVPRRIIKHGELTAATKDNIKELERQSVRKRKEFRGVHIGELT